MLVESLIKETVELQGFRVVTVRKTGYGLEHCCPVNWNKKGLNLNELLQCECDQTL